MASTYFGPSVQPRDGPVTCILPSILDDRLDEEMAGNNAPGADEFLLKGPGRRSHLE